MTADQDIDTRAADLADSMKFVESVRPQLEELEVIRQAKYKAYQWRLKVGGAIGAALTPVAGYIDYMLILWSSSSDDGAFGATVLLWTGLWRWITAPKRRYAKAYKKEILPKIARLFGDFTYKAKGKVSMALMRASKIVPGHDRYKSEDYFEGIYKGTKVEFSEIELEEKRRSNKRTRYVTVFKGLAILIDLPENKFFGHTILKRDAGRLGEWFREKGTGLDRARLVDPAFEEQYDVYTDDQVEARYILDPVMMERVKELAEIYSSDGISCAWYRDKMLALIPSKENFFEPADIKIKATNPVSVKKMKQEVDLTLSLVDHLKLYDPEKAHQEAREADRTAEGRETEDGREEQPGPLGPVQDAARL